MDKSSTGIVYVATRQHHFIVEAFLSAHSVREFLPDIPITLYTDLTDTPYAKADCFSQVIPLKTTRSYTSLWAEGQLDRIKSLANSPYYNTLHLDTDTRIITADICNIFSKLNDKDIAMAVCEMDASVCASGTGLEMFNVGVILFKKSEKTMQLLEAWKILTSEHFKLASQDPVPEVEYLSYLKDTEQRKRLLFMDQTSMVQLLSPNTNKFCLDLEILDEGWNFRGTSNNRKLEHTLKISHDPALRNILGADTVNRALQYQKFGNIKFARKILLDIHREFPLNDVGKKNVARLIEKNKQLK
jgi:hypothetical protein